MKHKNPYRVRSEKDLYDICENSSHPELVERRRIYDFKGKIFRTATELDKYFKDNGLDIRRFWFKSAWEQDGHDVIVRIRIVERVPTDERHMVKEMTELYERTS